MKSLEREYEELHKVKTVDNIAKKDFIDKLHTSPKQYS